MYKVKVTIKHSHFAAIFERDLDNKILDLLSISKEFWELVKYTNFGEVSFESAGGISIEFLYSVRPKALLTFKESFTNLVRNCGMPLAQIKFEYIG